MDLSLTLSHAKSPEQELKSLLNWFDNPNFNKTLSLRAKRSPSEGVMGGEVVAIIVTILGTPAAIELIRSIKDWIAATKSKARIEVVAEDGKRITISMESFSAVDAAERLATKLLKSSEA